MAATAASDVTDGPVLSLINKRLRALRKKHNRILQLEEAMTQGKPILKEQEEVLRSKPGVVALIDELEKLRQPLSAAVSEEVNIALQRHSLSPLPPSLSSIAAAAEDDKPRASEDEEKAEAEKGKDESGLGVVEDLLNLLYFGSLFDVKPQSDFTSTMLTRTHERGCCLTYDYVTDDATDDLLLGEGDLDLISLVGSLLISRPVDSSFSHKHALERCINRAKLWLDKSDQPIEPDFAVTYAGLRERLNKIMASDYFTTTPEIKAPVEVAAAAGNYASFQVPVQVTVPVQVESSVGQYQQEEDNTENFQGHESGDNQSSSEGEVHKEELVMENSAEVVSAQQEQVKPQAELEENQRDVESKEQQYIPRRTYPNQRGGRGGGGGVGGGRRGYSNGRGGRIGGRGGGSYQNGRNQFYEQPGNYYPRNYNNNRGRGGRGGGGHSYNNHGSAVQAGHASGDVGLGS